MKNITEVYEIVLVNLEKDYKRGRTNHGICFYIINVDLELSGIEVIKDQLLIRKTLDHFKSNRPTFFRHKAFYNHISYVNGNWWWNRDDQGHTQRIIFLAKIIEISKRKSIWFEIKNYFKK